VFLPTRTKLVSTNLTKEIEMKLRKFWKYAAATAVLFTALPMCTYAQTVPNRVTTQFITAVAAPADSTVGVEIWTNGGANNGTIFYNDAGGVFANRPFTPGVSTIQLNGVDIATATDPGPGGLVSTGVGINNVNVLSLNQKTINTGNINITGNINWNNAYLTGFSYYSNAAQAFDGTLQIGDVNVRNTHATGDAAGVTFGTYFNVDNITGSIKAGNIKVEGTNALGFLSNHLQAGATVELGNVDITAGNGLVATGIDVGNIGDGANGSEKLTVGNVNVTSSVGGSEGVWMLHVNADGIFEAKDITVKDTGAGGTARGILANNIDADSTFKFGKIEVESDNSAARGIDVDGATFTVTKDVIAKSNAAVGAGAAIGIATGTATANNSNITIDTKDGDVLISGDATVGNLQLSVGMYGNNDRLTITGANTHTNKGRTFNVLGAETIRWNTNAEYTNSAFGTASTLTTHQVATGRTVITNGAISALGGNYQFGSNVDNRSAGTLVANTVSVVGNVDVHNGLLAIDGNGFVVPGLARNIINGTLTIGNANPAAQASAAVALYGNVRPGTVSLAVDGGIINRPNAVVDPTTGETVLSLSTITEYRSNPARNAYIARNRDKASLADGFLLPASIHNRITGWEATRDHLISGGRRVRSGSEFRGQAPCDPCEPVGCDPCEPACEPCEPTCDDVVCDPCDPCNKFDGFSLGRSAWVNYIGRSNSYRSSYSNIGIENGDWKIGSDGIQVGLDLFKTRLAQFGILFGYEGSVGTLRSDRMEADDVYVGIYGAKVFRNGSDFRAVYNFGSQDYNLRRLDPGLGLDWHTHLSNFSGNTHEVNLEFGKRIYSSNRVSYRPVIGLDLYINDWDGAQEDGNLSTAIAYDNADYLQAFLRIGSDLQIKRGKLTFNSGLYYSYDLNGDDVESRVFARDGSALGFDRRITSTLRGSDLGRSVLTFNVGSSYALSPRSSVFGGFTGDAVLDRDGDGFQSIGYVGLQWKW
jgi:hypothetical protein